MIQPVFEVCLEGVDGALAAQRGGAQRIELCAALVEGGITPSLGTIQACRDAVDIDIMVMIRPRGGDFLYSPAELDAMAKDIEACASVGVTGVVFGILETDGRIATGPTKALVELARPMSVTFHRAFDVASDAFQSLETLIELGLDRVLTSGQEATVPQGKERIRQLVERSAGRIGILPGCGITPENVADLVRYTGVKEFHATAFRSQKSAMTFRNERVYMGIPGLAEYERQVSSAEEVRRFLSALGGQ